MTKSKQDKLAEPYTLYQAAKTGQPPKRGARDGSIPTKSVVPCPDLPEAEVLKQCLTWLRARRVFCDRHDCGSGPGHVRYGILGAGDIIGILPYRDEYGLYGYHFEVETKKGRGGRLSEDQQERMRGVRAAGGKYFVVHGTNELAYYFKGLI